MSTSITSDEEIAQTLRRLAERRGPARSFCPSEAARALSEEWLPLMPRVRAMAGRLIDQGALRATQRGQRVDPRSARGPIRLALAGDA
ncbi:MAG: DUF3253 domain-containing protein [Pseudomonadota bacterium]